MNRDEYNILFHRLQLNLVAFKSLMDCDEEVLKLVNAAIEAEREACAEICDREAEWREINPAMGVAAENCADYIRNRGEL